MDSRIVAATETVDIGDVKPHLKNPRRGDVAAIAESLAAHGQYRPIVANRRTGRILAGNHTWQAAKQLGWSEIAVSWVDVDQSGEDKITLVDNRASDLANYDENLLISLLKACGDVGDTGYSPGDLDALEGLWDAPTTVGSGKPEEDFGSFDADINVGPYRMTVERDPFDAWAMPIEQHTLRPEETIRRRLDLPQRNKPKASDPETTPVKLSTISAVTININTISPYEGNARQGDVGAISESLTVNGQYRPIVVNKRDNTILVGNHTWQAARSLGWDQIAVTFVDVDEDEARKIVLVDNRTADLATYDTDALIAMLNANRHDLHGTGFDGDDLDDLIASSLGKPSKPVITDIKIKVDRWSLKLQSDLFNLWSSKLGSQPEQEIANRLQLPDGSWSVSPNQGHGAFNRDF